MSQKQSGETEPGREPEDQGPKIRDRRRFDPSTGERKSEASSAEEPSEGERIELPGGGVLQREEGQATPEPEVDFGDLVRPFLMMGMTGLGVIPHPDTGKPLVDLPAARHAIATLQLLRDRTEGRLSEEESRLLEQALFELQMQFVELNRRSPGR